MIMKNIPLHYFGFAAFIGFFLFGMGAFVGQKISPKPNVELKYIDTDGSISCQSIEDPEFVTICIRRDSTLQTFTHGYPEVRMWWIFIEPKNWKQQPITLTDLKFEQ
jgi:hypothetical protein